MLSFFPPLNHLSVCFLHMFFVVLLVTLLSFDFSVGRLFEDHYTWYTYVDVLFLNTRLWACVSVYANTICMSAFITQFSICASLRPFTSPFFMPEAKMGTCQITHTQTHIFPGECWGEGSRHLSTRNFGSSQLPWELSVAEDWFCITRSSNWLQSLGGPTPPPPGSPPSLTASNILSGFSFLFAFSLLCCLPLHRQNSSVWFPS